MERSGMAAIGARAVLTAACTNPCDPSQRAVGGGLIGAARMLPGLDNGTLRVEKGDRPV